MNKFNLRQAISQGLIASIIALSVSAIGMVELFGERFLINGALTMGQVLIFLATITFSYQMASKMKRESLRDGLLTGLVVGLVNGLMMWIFIWFEGQFDVRSFFINISPRLIELLTFEQARESGSLLLVVFYALVGMAGAGMRFIPRAISSAITGALTITLGVGLLSELIAERIRNFFGVTVMNLIFKSDALQLIPALLLFGISVYILYRRHTKQSDSAKIAKPKPLEGRSKLQNYILSGFLLILPLLLGTYLTEITNNVGIFILMGLGLNIVVGLAGLLDLGYVAFFAIGAYTMAILTSTADLGIAQMSFWAALPICVGVSAIFGMILGIPVLRMRGDYLAIVTLGFGEIIRILALSDMLKPFIGGAQGILKIPKPAIGSFVLLQPQQLYYVVLAGVLLAAFISIRLRDSRLGRRWMAMREDEDVAEAMGINLVSTKILAFGIGAAFSGLAGAIFASKLTSIFPHSFSLLISINVLSLIIVGGLGSIPGTIAGAIVLVGLPELLREFAEFRWLMYGLLLIAMMLIRPEGFIPSDVIKRELHADDEPGDAEVAQA
jgi:branched-chain amino acid transport system permease protein